MLHFLHFRPTCTLLYYESYGIQILDAFYTFVFGDIGLRNQSLKKNLKKIKNLKIFFKIYKPIFPVLALACSSR